MDSERKSDIKEIRKALDTLNQHKFVRIYNSSFRLLWFQFFKGVAFGLGSVIGATIVVSLLISLLSQIELIPIVGEFAKEIALEIQEELKQ